jgi:hypothetical protein
MRSVGSHRDNEDLVIFSCWFGKNSAHSDQSPISVSPYRVDHAKSHNDQGYDAGRSEKQHFCFDKLTQAQIFRVGQMVQKGLDPIVIDISLEVGEAPQKKQDHGDGRKKDDQLDPFVLSKPGEAQEEDPVKKDPGSNDEEDIIPEEGVVRHLIHYRTHHPNEQD